MNLGPRLGELAGFWALVTGASSGIGAEFCKQLAAAKVNLVMVARRTDRMNALADALMREHGVRTLVSAVDLSDARAVDVVMSTLLEQQVRIRLLVNNAAYGPWGRFEAADVETYSHLVQLVTGTPIAFCRAFFDDFCSFPGAAVINLSSPAAIQPVPYKAAYSAAKTGLHYFSLALYEEWRSRNILVQTLIPGPTESELDEKGNAYPSALPEDREPPGRVVRLSLENLGHDKPVVTAATGIFKQRFFNGLFPYKTITRTVGKMFYPPPGPAPD
jgi:short-subunit dehydrogenase